MAVEHPRFASESILRHFLKECQTHLDNPFWKQTEALGNRHGFLGTDRGIRTETGMGIRKIGTVMRHRHKDGNRHGHEAYI